MTAYDYIVVGAGSAGCVLARRLVEGSDATVLLIEAGPMGMGVPEIETPSAWMSLGRGVYDWGYDYAPTARVNNRIIGIPRGKVLGGSSAINAMMWYRGHPADYDAWEAAGATGWNWRACLPYFRRCEDWQGGASEWRGAGGPLRIERSADMHPIARALIDAAGGIGIPVIDDPNGPSNEGAGPSNFNISQGRRFSSAQGYLWPVLDHPRLTVLTGALATELLFDATRCTGIRHLVAGAPHESHAGTAVVLTAGAIDTPRLLMLSGIGDPAQLQPLGIPVRHALPGIGRNLQDHPLVRACNFRARRPLGPVRDNGGGSMLNWKSAPGLAQPDVHAFPVQGRSAVPRLLETHDLSGDLFAIGTGLMRSRSVGYLRMLEARPGGALEIQPNYLAEPADLDALVRAVGQVQEMAQSAAFADWFGGFAAPEKPGSRSETIAFIRDACSTFFHTCGTCAMGTDASAVVDPRLMLRGIEGVMIADASVIPVIPSCNTHAPVTMIAERAADFLLGHA